MGKTVVIHHVIAGNGRPPLVFVHGFGCAHADWRAQVVHLSPRHQTIAVDLRGHGATPGTADACSIRRYGADVAEVVRALALPPAVMVGHSMGCRVVIEAALQTPEQTAGIILVDGSQFAASMRSVLEQRFAEPNGYARFVDDLFRDMFTAKSDTTMVTSVVERAGRLPRSIGEKLLMDMLHYDVDCLAHALAKLHLPVMAVQTTYSNEKRQRVMMTQGQTTPYLSMLQANIPSARIEVISNTGHFPQLDESAQTNALIDDFIRTLP